MSARLCSEASILQVADENIARNAEELLRYNSETSRPTDYGTATDRNICSRRGRLQPANGPRRSWDTRSAEDTPARDGGRQDRRASGPHRQGHRRRHAGRIPERGECSGLRHRHPAQDARAQRRRAGGPPHRVPHRHPSRRHHLRGQRHLWRRRQRGGAHREHCQAGRRRRVRYCPRPYRQPARSDLRGHRRADAEEH